MTSIKKNLDKLHILYSFIKFVSVLIITRATMINRRFLPSSD